MATSFPALQSSHGAEGSLLLFLLTRGEGWTGSGLGWEPDWRALRCSHLLTALLSSRSAVERRRRFNINDRIKELGMLIPKANDLYVSLVSGGLGYQWASWACSSPSGRRCYFGEQAVAGAKLFFHPAPQGRALEQRDDPESFCGLHQEDAEGPAEVARPGEPLSAVGDDKQAAAAPHPGEFPSALPSCFLQPLKYFNLPCQALSPLRLTGHQAPAVGIAQLCRGVPAFSLGSVPMSSTVPLSSFLFSFCAFLLPCCLRGCSPTVSLRAVSLSTTCPYALSLRAVSHRSALLQELEMQARVHGLPTSSPSGVNVAELAQQVVKQEAGADEGMLEPLLPPPDPESQPVLPPPPQSPYHQLDFSHSLSFDDGSQSFPDSLEPSHGASFPSLSKKELDLMLLQDTMLPLASDPLFSAVSPEASKASSRRSSFSMEDADML